MITADFAVGKDMQPRLSDAVRDVLAERQRQIDEEGWSAQHDDEHHAGSMAIAAACYALADFQGPLGTANTVSLDKLWEWTGWSTRWWKPKDRLHNLVRAAALLLAEIEREHRKAKNDRSSV